MGLGLGRFRRWHEASSVSSEGQVGVAARVDLRLS